MRCHLHNTKLFVRVAWKSPFWEQPINTSPTASIELQWQPCVMARWTKKQTILAKHIISLQNDLKHATKSLNKWFRKHDINVLQWLSRSPDLNSTENRLSKFKMEVYLTRNIKHLESLCIEEVQHCLQPFVQLFSAGQTTPDLVSA